eukprot:gene11761-24661_t
MDDIYTNLPSNGCYSLNIDEKKCFSGETSYHLKAYICSKLFEWIINIETDSENLLNSSIDVTPLSMLAFSDLNYDPYSVRDNILTLCPQLDGKYDINLAGNILIEHIIRSQSTILQSIKNERFLLNLEMLHTIRNVTIIPFNEEYNHQIHTKVYVQFKLLEKQRLTSIELEYLADVTETNPIYINIAFLLGNNNALSADTHIFFPPTMPCSKFIEIPKWTSDTIILDYLLEIESRLAGSWTARRLFLEELQRIAAVVEFDPIDFSFVSIAIRLKLNKVFAVCTVEMRLSHTFPSTAPLLAIFDLQTAFSSVIESTAMKYSSSWGAERAARELFLLSCDIVHTQAFGQSLSSSS